jgi:transcriptional regulator with XRE-family HTH domain
LIEAAQIRAARGLLALSQVELAEMAGLSVASVKRLETAEGVRGAAETIWKIQRALEAAGVEFIPEEAGRGPGVRLKHASKGRAQ